MKYKVSELEGALLDAAVAKAEGFGEMDGLKVYSDTCWLAEKNEHDQFIQDVRYQPSTDWSLGGPIIERERISTIERGAEGWMADMRGVSPVVGCTPLIAAMRAFVASKLGEEVEIP